MAVRELWESGKSFLDFCAVYYVIQLIRCALISFGVFALVFLLRKTLFKNSVFPKGVLWGLFLPVLFLGKMKFFYENQIGVILFSWWTGILINHRWVNWLYLCGASASAVWLLCKRRELKKWICGMEKREVCGTLVCVTKLPVTPFVTGVLRPKIILPEVMLEACSERELDLILLHEKTHIRLGHLWFYSLWNLLRVLLWINPFFIVGSRYFREDMEEICDFVTIQRSGAEAYTYGRLLLKSVHILQAENEDFHMSAAFSGDREYQKIRQRMAGIAMYRPYKQITAVTILLFTVLCIAGISVWVRDHSYGRYNENDVVIAYGFDGEKVTFSDSSESLHQIISYDDTYVYVKREAFEKYLEEKNAAGDIFIVFGGFYKLPGVGGMGYSCCYEPGAEGEIAKIAYESPMDNWRVKLLKLI